MPAAKKKTAEKAADASTYAVIETGGKQYGVSAGDVIRVEILPGKAAGEAVVFDKVLLVDDGSSTTIGTPYITGAAVKGTVKKEGRAQKLVVMRYKQKSRTGAKRGGHRQPYMDIAIEAIQ